MREVMTTDVETLPAELSIGAAIATLRDGRHQSYPVIDADGRLVGLASRSDALEWQETETAADETIGERISDPSLPIVPPDVPVARALDLMLSTDQGRLPVTDPATGKLLGLLTRKDLLQVRATVARIEGDRRAFFPR